MILRVLKKKGSYSFKKKLWGDILEHGRVSSSELRELFLLPIQLLIWQELPEATILELGI